jgi:hypothetical protein
MKGGRELEDGDKMKKENDSAMNNTKIVIFQDLVNIV